MTAVRVNLGAATGGRITPTTTAFERRGVRDVADRVRGLRPRWGGWAISRGHAAPAASSSVHAGPHGGHERFGAFRRGKPAAPCLLGLGGRAQSLRRGIVDRLPAAASTTRSPPPPRPPGGRVPTMRAGGRHAGGQKRSVAIPDAEFDGATRARRPHPAGRKLQTRSRRRPMLRLPADGQPSLHPTR